MFIQTSFDKFDYINKFNLLTKGLITPEEAERFLGLVQKLPTLTSAQLLQLNIEMDHDKLTLNQRDQRGIF